MVVFDEAKSPSARNSVNLQERLGHASIQITLDTYSHVAPGLQQAAAEGFDRLLNHEKEGVENFG
jgi:integrase